MYPGRQAGPGAIPTETLTQKQESEVHTENGLDDLAGPLDRMMGGIERRARKSNKI